MTATPWRRALQTAGIVIVALIGVIVLGRSAARAFGVVPAVRGQSSSMRTGADRRPSSSKKSAANKQSNKSRTKKTTRKKSKKKLAVSTGAPVVKGSPIVGQKLTTTNGTWTNQPVSYTYAWVACNANGLACSTIAGADTNTYTVSAGLVGDTLRSAVTAVTSTKTKSLKRSAATAAVTETAPANTVVPSISGAAQQGHTLTASVGTWSGSPTAYSYTWSGCSGGSCTPISGASTTSGTYQLQSSDVGHTIEVTVTASNAGGAGQPATSQQTLVVLPALLVNESPPTIVGTAQAGNTLTATTGTWSGPATGYHYTWEDCSTAGACTAIPSASTTSGSYTLQSSDVGSTIVVAVNASNAAGSALEPASSAPTGVVGPNPSSVVPVASAPPAISGTAQVGVTLAASTGTWSGSPTSYSYSWALCTSSGCSAISGASAAQFTVPAADLGDKLEVSVKAANGAGAGAAATSSQTPAILPAAPIDSVSPSISGIAKVGDTLKSTTGTWSGAPSSYSYAWEQCTSSACGAIAGASTTSGQYTVGSATVGDTIKVAVTASNSGGAGSPATSNSMGPVPQPAPSNETPPTISGSPVVGTTLTASPGTWTGSPSFSYQWEWCPSGSACSAISGATSASYTVSSTYLGDTIEVVVTATNASGSTSADSTATPAVSSGVGVSGGSCSSPCTAAPDISGSAAEGATLSVTAGSWSDSPGAYGYQWEDCNSSGASCTNVASGGSNVRSYIVKPSDAGHTIVAAVTAVASASSAVASSAPTPVVASGGPSDSVLPAVSGSAVAGDTLSASQGTWSGSGLTFAYQWSDCIVGGGNCSVISGATGSSYTVQSSDEGFAVEVTVTASNGSGSEAVSSAVTAAVPVPPSNIDVAISGLAVLGSTLTVRDHWSGSGLALSYQWLDCSSSGGSCSNIAGATGATYVVAAADETHAIEVKVSASNGGGSVSATSSATAVIQSPVGSGTPASTGAPVVSGSPGEGDPLAVTVGTWSGVPTSYSFQWQDCNSSGASCSNVESGTGTSYVYVPTSKDVGDTLRVEVTATNSSGSASATSAATAGVTALGAASNGGLTIVGDQLVNDAGAVVVPHGVDRSGSEYACWQFDAISDGPIDAPATAAMSTWNINMVRVQLNEDCWLGIDGVPANVSGQNYVNAIKAWVNILHEYGIYAYISLMSGHPGSEAPDNNEPNAPDEDHSPLFWEQLASTFKNDPNVILAPQSELSSSGVDWNCYINGCSNEAASPNTTAGPFDGDATCYSSSSLYCGYYYQSAGMKQAVEIMRDAGYNGPIGIPCVNWADECSSYDGEGTLGGTWQSEVPSIDPDHQVMAEIHSYTNGSVCASPGCYNATLSPILAAGYPVIFGELGENGDCAADSGGVAGVMPWAVSNGVGWLSFAWDVYGFCTLISSYEPPTPWGGAGDYGAYVQALDQSLPG